MPRWEHKKNGDYIEFVERRGIRKGKIGQSKPTSFREEKLDPETLQAEGYEKVGPAGTVWDFTADEASENKILSDRNARDPYLEYARWMKKEQPWFARFIEKGAPDYGKVGTTGVNTFFDELFGDLDHRPDPKQFRNGFAHTWQLVDSIPLDEFRAFLNLPVMRLLETLDVSFKDVSPVIPLLASWPHLERLRKLSLWGTGEPELDEEESSPLGDFTSLWPRLQNLETFYLCGSAEKKNLKEISLPSVRHFARQSFSFDKKEFQNICKAKWPQLEAMTLGFGPDSNVKARDFQMLWEIEAPHLKKLDIRYYEQADGLIPQLAESPLLKRLTHLGFYQSSLSAKGVKALLKHRDSFAHLEKINIRETTLEEEDGRKLFEALPAVDQYNAFREPGTKPYQLGNYQDTFWEERRRARGR